MESRRGRPTMPNPFPLVTRPTLPVPTQELLAIPAQVPDAVPAVPPPSKIVVEPDVPAVDVAMPEDIPARRASQAASTRCRCRAQGTTRAICPMSSGSRRAMRVRWRPSGIPVGATGEPVRCRAAMSCRAATRRSPDLRSRRTAAQEGRRRRAINKRVIGVSPHAAFGTNHRSPTPQRRRPAARDLAWIAMICPVLRQ